MKNKNLSNEEISMFCGQLSMMLRDGISAEEALLIIAEDAEGHAELYNKAAEKLGEGKQLSEALRETGGFPEHVAAMLAIGESAGRAEQVAQSLGRYYARKAELRDNIKSAVAYPAAMLCIMAVVVVILITRVLPVFSEVFAALGGEMKGLAAGAAALGRGMSAASAWLIGLLVLLAAALLLGMVTKKGRELVRRAGWALFPDISEKTAQADFASAMAVLMQSGVYPDKALEQVRPLIENEKYSERLSELSALMESGEGFAESCAKLKIFPLMQARMLSVGFKTGSIDEAMESVADGCARAAAEKTNRLVSVIEPTLAAVMCLIVGMILLSAMLPIIGAMSAMV